MNTFLTSYNKNKALSTARQEPIAERRVEESGSSDGQVQLPSSTTPSALQIDVRTKEGFKDLVRF
jgi:hypothetical protein